MKQIRQILLGGLLLAIVTTVARAQYNYITNNGTITITGYTGPGGSVTIPSTINGLSVTSIGDNAFGSTYPVIIINNVIIPNSVTNIGNDGFWGNMALSSVTFGSGLISIGNSAFVGCAFTSISLPNSLLSIGNGAFNNTHLSGVSIPASVTNISGNPFPNCTSLGSIGVATNNPAYTNISGVLLSKDLTTLVGYPPGKTGGSYLIFNGVVTIDNYAFDGCTKLTNVSIPNGVVSIGTNAFANCSGLTNIMIPVAVTNIGAGPFTSCGNLTAISVDSNNPAYRDIAGVLFDANIALVQYPGGYPTNHYTIPASATAIQAGAFQLCSKFTGITIPNGVVSIGDFGFFGCTGLANVIIPDSVTNLGANAFADCPALTNVTLSSNIATVSPEAFLFSGLVNIMIPLGVKDIGAAAFEDTPLGTLTIPASVTNIETDAFVSCSALSNVVISGSVSNIGFDAFEHCANLAGVYFEGRAPAADSTAFRFDSKATVFFLPGTSGWGSSLGGAPTAIWQPAMRNSGMVGGQFGFNISWASNYSVTVSANNDLTTTNWSPLTNIVVTNGSVSFNDATPANNGQRYYRLSWP